MPSHFNEADHPREGGGKFTGKSQQFGETGSFPGGDPRESAVRAVECLAGIEPAGVRALPREHVAVYLSPGRQYRQVVIDQGTYDPEWSHPVTIREVGPTCVHVDYESSSGGQIIDADWEFAADTRGRVYGVDGNGDVRIAYVPF